MSVGNLKTLWGSNLLRRSGCLILTALVHSSGLCLVTFDPDFERFGLARCRILPLV